MRTDINKINEHTPHTGLTEGMQVFAAGTSKYFKTGEWRNNTPVYLEDNCKQCLLCAKDAESVQRYVRLEQSK